MGQDLLFVEMALKGASGILLLLFPRSLARILGLPPVTETFWPRLLGALLAGLAIASFLEVRPGHNGVGLAGHVAINFAAVLAATGLLVTGRAGPTRRGRAFMVLVIAMLAVLALLELAWA